MVQDALQLYFMEERYFGTLTADLCKQKVRIANEGKLKCFGLCVKFL